MKHFWPSAVPEAGLPFLVINIYEGAIYVHVLQDNVANIHILAQISVEQFLYNTAHKNATC